MSKRFRLLAADRRFYLSSAAGALGGNSRMKIYGRLDCTSAQRAIARGNTYRQHRVFFADEATAIAAGYRPCGNCMRQQYKAWRTSQP